VGQGDTVAVGSCTLEVIALRGHTPGSIALLYDDPHGHPHLFTGDSLFPGGVGNTFGDEGAFASLIDDVEERIFQRLPDETWFYPGHGNDSTLGAERPHLGEWRERGW
jgi:glyoxylase-like metal-dependent hydrolase (beta-lactamase superfamily II)